MTTSQARLTLLSAALTALAVLAPACHAAAPPLGVTTRARLVRVVDGDTVDLEVTYTIRVRLLDCWVPDKNRPVNEQAEEDLTMYAGGKPVILHIPTSKARSLADVLTLNRTLGYVWKVGDKESLSEWQVKRGNASSQKNLPLGK
jgi:endonuclease YncB( thermonuclease family)